MGKNKTIYFDDECLELLERNNAGGSLINSLIKQHFSNDEETLKMRLAELDQELNSVRAKLEIKVSNRLKAENERREKLKLTKEEQKRQDKINEMKEKLRNGQIKEQEYWDFFDNQ